MAQLFIVVFKLISSVIVISMSNPFYFITSQVLMFPDTNVKTFTPLLQQVNSDIR